MVVRAQAVRGGGGCGASAMVGGVPGGVRELRERAMGYRLGAFAEVGLDEAMLEHLIGAHERGVLPRLERLWAYYRNALEARGEGGDRWYRVAQEAGLPRRLRGMAGGLADDRGGSREVVIENDIGWRVDAMVDLLFGRPIVIRSTASDARVRERVEAALESAWDASGGMGLLQDAALLGSVHGWVDFVVRSEGVVECGARRVRVGEGDEEEVRSIARLARIEVVEARRGVALVDPSDYRRIDAYVIRTEREGGVDAESAGGGRRRVAFVEVLSGRHRQVYADGVLVDESANPTGELGVVHVQNGSEPFRYAGRSDVEALIPLQDELNARLSDRAHRVTMQSFNMYLAKGLEGFGEMPVGPGQVWSTDNPEASVEAFGGDGASASEDRHIDEIRAAMDKASGVSPVVLGVVRERIGHLSSANALRLTLLGVLNRLERKRVQYGRGIARVCELVLGALDASGVLRTSVSERRIRIEWPEGLPVSEEESVRAASAKRALGVSAESVLGELGYADRDGALS